MRRGRLKTYYSAFDTLWGTYFAAGMNSGNREDCVKDIFRFLTEDSDMTEEELENLSLKEKEKFMCRGRVDIIEHKGKIDEEEGW